MKIIIINKYKIILFSVLLLGCSGLRKFNENYNASINLKKNIDNNYGCPEGAYYEHCGSGCGLPHCGGPNMEGVTVCPAVCTAGCVCMNGKLLDKRINKCVEPEDCFNYSY